jgi:hypothetical protein
MHALRCELWPCVERARRAGRALQDNDKCGKKCDDVAHCYEGPGQCVWSYKHRQHSAHPRASLL